MLALGPWTDRAQRWLALPQVLATRLASVTLAADLPAQIVFSDVVGPGGERTTFRIYPRQDGITYLTGRQEHVPLPDDPMAIRPAPESIAELRRLGGLHASPLGEAKVLGETACYRALTVDGLPLIGPVPGAPEVFLATGHGSWGILTGPPTGRIVCEMILEGTSHSLDATAYGVGRLPSGRRL